MTTQVIFKIDSKLKKQAQKKAASDGIPLSTMLNFATRNYVEGKFKMGLIPGDIEPVKMTKIEIAKLKKARENYKKGNYYTVEQIRRELGINN